MTADEDGFVRRILSFKPMVFIGLLSYSWYLWHWPLLSLYRIYNLGIQDAANAVIIVLAPVLAWLTYVLIENPIRVRRPGPFLQCPAGRCTSAPLIILVTMSMGKGLKFWRVYQEGQEVNQQVLKARYDYSPLRNKILDANKPLGELPFSACILRLRERGAKSLAVGRFPR